MSSIVTEFMNELASRGESLMREKKKKKKERKEKKEKNEYTATHARLSALIIRDSHGVYLPIAASTYPIYRHLLYSEKIKEKISDMPLLVASEPS